MAPTETLTRAINKAIENGWKRPSYLPSVSVQNLANDAVNGLPYVNTIIYNHQFAQALWDEDTKFVEQWNSEAKSHSNVPLIDIEKYQPEWQYHLQQLVISPDPIQYLSEHI